MANILYTFYFGSDETIPLWEEMTALMKSTFDNNLAGDWEYKLNIYDHTKPMGEIFYENFLNHYEFWKQGHNVFYVNPDVICVKPIEIFGKYDDLTMFWHSDPKSKDGYPVNFNGGIMYIPSTVKKDVWEYGLEEYKKLMEQKEVPWATDQDVYNLMLYKQGKDLETYKDNTMHYLARLPHYNDIDKSDAKMLHYFSTRGHQQSMDLMKEDLKELT